MIPETSDTTAQAIVWIPLGIGFLVMVGNALYRHFTDKDGR